MDVDKELEDREDASEWGGVSTFGGEDDRIRAVNSVGTR